MEKYGIENNKNNKQ